MTRRVLVVTAVLITAILTVVVVEFIPEWLKREPVLYLTLLGSLAFWIAVVVISLLIGFSNDDHEEHQ